MTIEQIIAAELKVKPQQVHAALELLDGGNTIPFIARYRKEATGTLDEEALRSIEERAKYLRQLEERRAEILAAIEAQEKCRNLKIYTCPTALKSAPALR